MKASIKLVTALMTVALMISVLAACGQAGNGNEAPPSTTAPTASAGPSASAPAAEEGACREIQQPQGTACVPIRPVRTLALLSDYADYMLAIGETPYAVLTAPQYDNKLLPYLASKLPDVELLEGGSEALNLEAVMALEPDLILADSFTAEKVYDSLSRIAPTVVLGGPSDDPAVERWESDLRKVAAAFGKPEAARQAVETLNGVIEEAKGRIALLEKKSIGFIRVRDKELQLYGSEGHPLSTLLYGKLGMEPSPLTGAERIDLSLEKIPDIGADYLFLQTDGTEGEKYLEEIRSSALWNNVEAVRNDQVFTTDYWIYLGWGVLGQQEIVRQLLADLGL